jgi:hypothetical protein
VVIISTRYLNVYLPKPVYNKAINRRKDFKVCCDIFC